MIFIQRILRLALPAFLFLAASTAWGQSIDTISPDGLFQAARKAAFEKNDYALAKKYAFKALRVSPDYTEISIFLGNIYNWTKNYDSARIIFSGVWKKQPDNEEVTIPYADLEYNAGNYEKALLVTQNGLQNNPASEALMLRNAKTLNALKRFTEADRAINKLLLLNPKNTEAIALSNSFRQVKNKNSAQQNLPAPPRINTTGTDTVSSDGLFQAARKAAFDDNNYPLAKKYLFKALQLSPDYADVRIFLGRIYTWTKNYDSGRIAFKRVLSKQPNYEDALLASADLEYFTKNYPAALQIITAGLKNNPTSEPLMLSEIKILRGMERVEDARLAVNRLLLLNPNNKDALAIVNSMKQGSIAPVETPKAPVDPIVMQPRNGISSDSLLVLARKAAFTNKDYEQAKTFLYQALEQSPGYADIKVFLGRIHTWTSNYDSARYYFTDALKVSPGHADASVAYSDMEYWNNNNEKALSIVNEGLVSHPASEDLLVRKARILSALRRYAEAENAVQEALRINRNNSDARLLANRIKELATKNKIGLSYDYVYFDKQFSDPWHLVSFDYTRRTGIGSVTGRVNYANRFKENGVQYELEAYPRISKTFYSYVSAGYSENVGIFPKWRGGFSLYINLPKSYEAELGFRYLKFSSDPTWIYTAYLGKYFRSWLFGARTYITPGTFTSTVSTSYSASARYYFGGADDFFGFNAGYGISPDDRFNSIQIDSKVRLVTYKTGLTFKKKVSRFNVVTIDGSWFNQEYLPQTKGNQYQISLGWQRRF